MKERVRVIGVCLFPVGFDERFGLEDVGIVIERRADFEFEAVLFGMVRFH